MDARERPSVARVVASIAVTAAVFALALFLPAGTVRWPEGWAFLAVYFGFVVALSVWLYRFNPGLLNERMTGIGRADQKGWDKVLLAVAAVVFVAWLVVMPLDAVRFRWSHVPRWLEAAGLVLLIVSFRLLYLTARENPYLSPAVRIQTERGHQVVTTGLYAHVRHPMYASVVPMIVGTSLMLGSWVGLAVGALLLGLVAWRAVREERVLRDELPGYREYMDRVRYRLVPHVW
jgi:protein-S-isoprenylcysteine O-methyltransferase Ste14